ncbi:MAG: Unknown protein [uncultured Sulfurovum sp.]|uniref:Uncharacterized protein n=1 Tax=uncultured Sulfurovum sp. TaxID=269237 RepID=A0A6S6SZD6_9BACT|nr:MAG: Unknown protein [uncultured Sulfurovum sp.]
MNCVESPQRVQLWSQLKLVMIKVKIMLSFFIVSFRFFPFHLNKYHYNYELIEWEVYLKKLKNKRELVVYRYLMNSIFKKMELEM